MELMRVEMRTGNLTVECSDLSTSQSGEIEAGNPIAVPLVPMGKGGKNTSKDMPKLCPKLARNLPPTLAAPPFSSKSKSFILYDF